MKPIRADVVPINNSDSLCCAAVGWHHSGHCEAGKVGRQKQTVQAGSFSAACLSLSSFSKAGKAGELNNQLEKCLQDSVGSSTLKADHSFYRSLGNQLMSRNGILVTNCVVESEVQMRSPFQPPSHKGRAKN